MLIPKFDPIVKWAERIDRCTVRGAAGNSTSLGRKWTCLESQAGALNQRSSEDAKVRIQVSKNLYRRRRRGLGRSKKIPDISRGLWLAAFAIASGHADTATARSFCRPADPVVAQ